MSDKKQIEPAQDTTKQGTAAQSAPKRSAARRGGVKQSAPKRSATRQDTAAPGAAGQGARLSKGEEIGLAAGEVWHCLDRVGEASPSKLAAETNLSAKDIQRAIGWLAREGKLIIESDGRTEVFRLA